MTKKNYFHTLTFIFVFSFILMIIQYVIITNKTSFRAYVKVFDSVEVSFATTFPFITYYDKDVHPNLLGVIFNVYDSDFDTGTVENTLLYPIDKLIGMNYLEIRTTFSSGLIALIKHKNISEFKAVNTPLTRKSINNLKVTNLILIVMENKWLAVLMFVFGIIWMVRGYCDLHDDSSRLTYRNFISLSWFPLPIIIINSAIFVFTSIYPVF